MAHQGYSMADAGLVSGEARLTSARVIEPRIVFRIKDPFAERLDTYNQLRRLCAGRAYLHANVINALATSRPALWPEPVLRLD